MSAKREVTGGCHCQAVRFSAQAAPDPKILSCNCSICARTGYAHLIVAHEDFTLLSGSDQLQSYRFGSGQANHLFCKICGVKSFYQPRSHPDSWSINLNCLDDDHGLQPQYESFDGRNWEAARARLDSSD